MSDIFISYSREDKPKAEKIARALEEHGWSVWWDRKIPVGKSFDKIIEEQLSCAKCVMVLWSNHSIHSNWVKEEANEGQIRNILAPVMIEDIRIPLGFRRIQAAKLISWNGDAMDESFSMLAEDVKNIIGMALKEDKESPIKNLPVRESVPEILPNKAQEPVAPVTNALTGTERTLLLVYNDVSMNIWELGKGVPKSVGTLKVNINSFEYVTGQEQLIINDVINVNFQKLTDDFNYIVIEYMVNGNLQKILFTKVSLWGGLTLKIFEGIYAEYKKGKLPFIKNMQRSG